MGRVKRPESDSYTFFSFFRSTHIQQCESNSRKITVKCEEQG